MSVTWNKLFSPPWDKLIHTEQCKRQLSEIGIHFVYGVVVFCLPSSLLLLFCFCFFALDSQRESRSVLVITTSCFRYRWKADFLITGLCTQDYRQQTFRIRKQCAAQWMDESGQFKQSFPLLLHNYECLFLTGLFDFMRDELIIIYYPCYVADELFLCLYG